MAKQVITLGTGTIFSNTHLTFNARSNLLDPRLLAQGSPAAYFVRLWIIGISDERTPDMRFRTSTTGGTSGTDAGPEMSDAWEKSAKAITVKAGTDWEFTFAGPDYPGNRDRDASEPYVWNTENYTPAQMRALVTAYNALSAAEKAATVMILDDDSFEGFEITLPAGITTTNLATWQGSASNNAHQIPDAAAVHADTYLALIQSGLISGAWRVRIDLTNSSGNSPDLKDEFETSAHVALVASSGRRLELGPLDEFDNTFGTDSDEPYFVNLEQAAITAFNNHIAGLVDKSVELEFIEDAPFTTDTDEIFILSASAPDVPSGGEFEENHTPTGWTRVRPRATATHRVYRLRRIRTFAPNGDFSSATAWGNLETVETLTTDTDEVFILSATVPDVPAGGTNTENHTPAGWSRVEPAAELGKAVYKVERTRTFVNGAFTEATAWGSLTVSQPALVPGPPVVGTINPVRGRWNQPFAMTLPPGRNGDPPLTETLVGTLPQGLSLFGRQITGTPRESGSFELTWRVTDARGRIAERTFEINIIPVTTTDEQTIYRLAASPPDPPAGGLDIANHLPAGWLRVEPSPDPDAGHNVYSVRRTRTITDGAFVSATAWGNLQTEAVVPIGIIFLGVGDTEPANITAFRTRDHDTGWQIRLNFQRDGRDVSPPASLKLVLKYGEVFAITDIPSSEFRASDQSQWGALVNHALANPGAFPLEFYLVNTDSPLINERNLTEIAVAIIDPGADLPYHYGKGFGITAEPRSVPNLPPLVDPGPRDLPVSPTVPTGFRLTPGNEQVICAWNAVISAIDYEIRHKLRSGVAWNSHVATGTSTAIGGLINGLEYEFQIRARNRAGKSDWSPSFYTFPALATSITALPAPTGLSGITGSRETGTVFITIFWQAVANAVRYKVRFKPTTSSVWDESYAPVSSTIFSLDIFSPGVRYEFQVKAIALNDTESDWSASYEITSGQSDVTDPNVGTALVISVDGFGETYVDLSWPTPTFADFIRAYEIQRQDSSSSWGNTQTTSGNVSSFRFPNLTSGTEYSFRVRYITTTGQTSPWSNVVMATPSNLPDTPQNVRGSDTGRNLTGSWDAVEGATRYEYIFTWRLSAGNNRIAQTTTGTTTGTSVTGPLRAVISSITRQLLSFQVRACDSRGCSAYGVYTAPGQDGTLTQTDSIYLRASSLPSTPTGGTDEQTHLPSGGWSRVEPEATETQGVYRSQRTLTFEDGVFDSATPWGTPTLFKAAVPAIPNVPTGVTASDTGSSHTAAWNAVAGTVDRYEYIFTWRLSAGSQTAQTTTGTTTGTSVTGPARIVFGSITRVLISFRVRACNARGCSSYATYTAPTRPTDPKITTRTDTIYRRAASTPSRPSGGTSSQTHLPSGWSRSRPAAAIGQGVYASSRTLTFRDNVFTSATSWGSVSRVTAPLPSPVVPSIPTGVRVTITPRSQAILRPMVANWNVSSGATRYEWEFTYRISAGSSRPLLRRSGTSTGTSATGPNTEIGFNLRYQLVSFRVRACNAQGCSGYATA